MRRRTGFDVVVRALILERAQGCCERCGVLTVCGQAHHRRPRQAGGSRRTDTNLPSNALWLCSGLDGGEACHEFVESHRSLSYDMGWLVHQGVSPGEVPVLRRNSWCLLDDAGGVNPVESQAIL